MLLLLTAVEDRYFRIVPRIVLSVELRASRVLPAGVRSIRLLGNSANGRLGTNFLLLMALGVRRPPGLFSTASLCLSILGRTAH